MSSQNVLHTILSKKVLKSVIILIIIIKQLTTLKCMSIMTAEKKIYYINNYQLFLTYELDERNKRSTKYKKNTHNSWDLIPSHSAP